MVRTHHISRLQYKVTCPDEAQAFELRHTLSSIVTEEVANAIDEICSRYVKDSEWIRIPRLEINLGNLSMHALRGYGTTLFSLQFEQQLRKQLDNLQYSPAKASKQTDQTEILLFFLATGVLPRWAFADIDLVDLTDKVLCHNPGRVKAFLTARSADGNIWLRIKHQLHDSAKDAIIALLPCLQTAYETIQSTIKQKLPVPIADDRIRDTVLLWAPFLFNEPNTETLLDQIIRSLSNEEYPIPTLEFTPSTSYHPTNNLLQTADEEDITFARPETQPLYSEAREDITLADEKLVIHTAGIILLHPFLKPFFTQLSLLGDGEWVSEEAQQKAIHLLHYLSTGKQQQSEWNLILEKILCGLPPERPVQKNIVLEETDIVECDALLTSAIEHWTALKSTSATALQEVFLQRDGLLLRTGKGWLLQVERKTHDILLEALPWNISMLKLPWTNYLIEVVWL